MQPSRSARHHLLWLAHSQGLKAGRVGEVIALAGLESVLILDEPFNGMGPRASSG